jgi:hypothetical protein
MEQKLLDLYIKLQPKFRDVMGEWQYTDDRYCRYHMKYNADIPAGVCSVSPFCPSCKHILFIPRTIDNFSEEARKRSLWGMLNWKRFLICPSFRNGDIWIKEKERAWEVFGTPTEAILRALCAQEGVEV